MINPVLKWALQILQNPEEIPTNDLISDKIKEALKLAGIEYNQIQVNCQPLESIWVCKVFVTKTFCGYCVWIPVLFPSFVFIGHLN